MSLSRGELLGAVAAVAVAGAAAVHEHTPAVAEVADGTATAGHVRAGQLAGLATAAALGAAVGLVAHDLRPLLAALAVAGAMALLYEWLRRRSS